MKQLILHIPHSSTYIPDNIRDQFCLSDNELNNEILKMTDHYTEELFDIENSKKVTFPVSRLVIDPERFTDDSLESMSKIGMGVVYTKTSSLTPLRNTITKAEKQSLIDQYYNPHHDNLNKACQESLDSNGECLIIDCHSFPKKSLPYELEANGNLARPEICIGTDSYHTSKELIDKVYSLFKDKGYYVSIDSPFAGALVPMQYYKKDKRVQSLMIEIRRDLYMSELNGDKNICFDKIKTDLEDILEQL
jgi:N-formylglutamate amidohydrolase